MENKEYKICDEGHDLPDVGDLVVKDLGHGWYEIWQVDTVSRIHTQQFRPNFVYVTVIEADQDWDDMTREQQENFLDSHLSIDDREDAI